MFSYLKGKDVFTPAGVVRVKAAAILSSNDLQARAYVMNQTQHNGEGGCSACEETGKVVKQGKGNTRCYPYREEHEKPILRTCSTATILACGHEAHVSGIRVRLLSLIMTYDKQGILELPFPSVSRRLIFDQT